MKANALFKMNHLGLVCLVAAFAVSLVRVVTLTRAIEGTGDAKIIKIVHWQLETGYRDSMNRVIEAYNNLPAVKAAKVQVHQMAVTERVYGQFLNIHLMSGTAPDLCEKGQASMSTGDFTARFFEPLGNFVTQPNPYNNDQTLPKDLDPQLRKILTQGAWRDTFQDGMLGGWDDKLQDFYSIPSSLFGSLRLYYNREMLAQAKQMIRDAVQAATPPKWFDEAILKTRADGTQTGYVTLSESFHKWLAHDGPPNTLGRLATICLAIRQMSRDIDNDKLVPIAGSKYSNGMFVSRFMTPFTYSMSRELDYNGDSSVTAIESYAAYMRGEWDFRHPKIVGYYQSIREMCDQFPIGFLGLDREQAMRRFTEKNAGMILSGAWDAGGIFLQAEGEIVGPKTRLRPDDVVTEINGVKRLNHKFNVGIMPFPEPGADERWGGVTSHVKLSEATTNAGATYSLFQRSPNKEWAIDFMRYLTSYAVNQEFNRGADWIPCIIGTTPADQMKPFTPNPVGVYPGAHIEFAAGGANFYTVMEGQMWLYQSGEISYDTFVQKVTDAMKDERTGLLRYWYDSWDKDRAAVRNQERMLAVYTVRLLANPSQDAMEKYKRGLLASVTANNGTNIKQMWYAQNPDKPFPKY